MCCFERKYWKNSSRILVEDHELVSGCAMVDFERNDCLRVGCLWRRNCLRVNLIRVTIQIGSLMLILDFFCQRWSSSRAIMTLDRYLDNSCSEISQLQEKPPTSSTTDTGIFLLADPQSLFGTESDLIERVVAAAKLVQSTRPGAQTPANYSQRRP